MSVVLQAAALLFGIAAAGLMLAALVAGLRAVRLGGRRLLFNGWDWVARPDRVPAEARPHIRQALRRWLAAAGCMVLAAVAGALAGPLP